MLIAFFGPPSPITHWGLHVIPTIVNVLVGPHDYLVGSTPADIRSAWGARSNNSVVFFSDNPDSELADVFKKAGAPLVVFADNAHSVIRFLIEERKLELRTAARIASQCFAALHDLYIDPKTLVLRRPTGRASVRAMVERIAEHYQLPFTPTQMDQILQRLIPLYNQGDDADICESIMSHVPIAKLIGRPGAAPHGHDMHLLHKIVYPLDELTAGKLIEKLIWPREMFMYSDRPDEHLTTATEMVGPSRFLIYGPYLHLPRGNWIATLQIKTTHNFSLNTLMIDVHSDRVLVQGRCPLPAEGIFSFEILIAVEHPRLPLQIRLAIERGAIEGTIDLADVQIRRV